MSEPQPAPDGERQPVKIEMAKKERRKKAFKPLPAFTAVPFPNRHIEDVLPHREADKPSPPDLWEKKPDAASEAQRGNLCAFKTGARLKDHAEVLAKLSRKYPELGKQVEQYRAELEAELLKQFGQITEDDQKSLVEICRYQLTELAADFLIAEGKIKNVVHQLQVGIVASEQRLRVFDRLFSVELRRIQKGEKR